MFIFLDESGDLGLTLEKRGTSRYVIVTLLVCESLRAFQSVKSSVRRTLRTKMNHKVKIIKHELKGTNTCLSIKEYFLNSINQSELKLYTIVLDKQNLTSRDDINKHRLYNQLSKAILEKIMIPITTSFVKLIVDRSKSGSELIEFNHYMRVHLESFLPLRTNFIIEHKMSKDNAGLQAVDLFGWGIFRRYEFNDTAWYSKYSDLIEFEGFFDEKIDDGP